MIRFALFAVVGSIGFGAVIARGEGATTRASDETRQPVPSADAIRAATREVNQLFGDRSAAARTRDERAVLASELLAAAEGSGVAPAARYVLLTRAADTAARIGDVQTLASAADAVTTQFRVDPIEFDLDLFATTAKFVGERPEASEVVNRLIDLSRQAADEDHFRPARRAAELAAMLARRSDDEDLARDAAAWEKQVVNEEAESGRVKGALAKLGQEPNDPGANLVVGKFYAFDKEQWPKGLEYLAQGNDVALKALAMRELAAPAEVTGQMALADDWWAEAAKLDPLAKPSVERHAAVWYRKVLESTTGLARVHVENRLK